MSSRFGQMAIAALAAAFAFPASANTTIGTYGKWDKVSSVAPFGCPDTTTYGQVITIPSGMHRLNSFTFWWTNLGSGSAFMAVRGYVYRWNGAGKTVQGSELFESRPVAISYSDTSFHPQGFGPGLAVTPGAQYVIFASIDREFVDCSSDNDQLGWGSVNGDGYSGGGYVYNNNAGNDLQWANPWSVFTKDLAFQANLSP